MITKPLEPAASTDEFLQGLGDHDAAIDELKKDTEAIGKTIRYVSKLDVESGHVEVGLHT